VGIKTVCKLAVLFGSTVTMSLYTAEEKPGLIIINDSSWNITINKQKDMIIKPSEGLRFYPIPDSLDIQACKEGESEVLRIENDTEVLIRYLYAVTDLKYNSLDDLPSDIDLEMRISVVSNRLQYRMETRPPGAQAVHAIPRDGTVIVPEALRKQLMRRALTHAQVFVSPHSKLLRKELIEAIEHEGIACYNSGIDFFPRLDFKGIVNVAMEGKDLEEFAATRDSKIIERAVQLYKIHLMPLDKDFKKVVLKLLRFIRGNEQLLRVISSLKVKPILEGDLSLSPGVGVLPKIVIYIGGGAADAQQALDILYREYHKQKGTGYGPSFNEQVTSFIYFAQGNRDEKMIYPEYFEQPNMVYFLDNVTGKSENYHLRNPKK
jgi:hypothetical protein